MIGAIAGDVIGSVYEAAPAREKDFELFHSYATFTDDTVMTVAVACAIMKGADYGEELRAWGRRYPDAGYGPWFDKWLRDDDAGPYNSYGNGSAMRVAAVGWAFDEMDTVFREAEKSAEVTHNHPEGIKGAQATAVAIFGARSGWKKDRIAALLSDEFGYDCSVPLEFLQRRGHTPVTCQHTMPLSGAAFLQSTDFEDCIRNCVSLGGDVDTIACIAGSIAEAHYGGVPEEIQAETLNRLDETLMQEVLAFAERYGIPLAGDL
jgi:ADP-ribosylglycohydrolase